VQVVTVLGSPNKAGATARVLGWVETALADAGHGTERFPITDYIVRGCTACQSCQGYAAEAPTCSQDDDANLILRAMAAADLFIVASPVYCWGFTSQIKALLDRSYAATQNLPEGVRRHLAGRRAALVVTAAGGHDSNIELLEIAFGHLMDYHHCRYAGSLAVPHCFGPDNLGTAVEARARQFAAALAAPSAPAR
jgi:multimeric flavodoxin WrbA